MREIATITGLPLPVVWIVEMIGWLRIRWMLWR